MKEIFHIVKIKRRRTSWSEEEDKTLVTLAHSQRRRSWKHLSENLSNKTPYQCYLRFKSIDPNVRRGTWDASEDEQILKAYKTYGKQWHLIEKVIVTRSAKQIRDRYINKLDPLITKVKFTKDEDMLILALHARFGNRWSLISTFLPSRSPDMIKNRFNSSVKRNKTLISNFEGRV
jgi:hypothetical protein